MTVGLLTLDIHLPYAHSLKEKRQALRKLKDRLRARYNVAVAELDHQDLWQRATVGVVSVSPDTVRLAQLLEAVAEESERVLDGAEVNSTLEYF
ncbi:MAG: DUF503 domain-containing protein [Candidatus Acidoferrales bacterium]